MGPGDDCAILRPASGALLAQTADQVVEGVHIRGDEKPAVWARKLVGRTLSDLAAAGATPWTLSWTAAVPPRFGEAWLTSVARAVLRESARYGVAVVGGDLSRSARAVLTATALGRCDRMPPGRSGARKGDTILVTGRLGGAVKSGRHLRPVPRIAEGRRLVKGLAPRALMDLSDGLATDLARICIASGVRAQIDLEALPLSRGLRPGKAGWRSAACDGEDYELLVVLPRARVAHALADSVLAKTGLTVIGNCIAGSPGIDWCVAGSPLEVAFSGWEHDWS